jgi:hypothetical protein
MVAAEVTRRVEEYSRLAGIDRVHVLEKMYAAFKCDPAVFFDDLGNILPANKRPEKAKMLFEGYSKGAATAAEKLTIASRLKPGFDLLDEIRPLAKALPPPPLADLQLNLDSFIARLRQRGDIFDVTPAE